MQNTPRLNVEALLAEFDEEIANTRRMLEKVPDEKLSWKPHERASKLAKLASHIAAMPLLLQLLTTGRSFWSGVCRVRRRNGRHHRPSFYGQRVHNDS